MPGCGSCSAGGLVASSLGFKDYKCCAAPCPNFPLHHVVICFKVNNCSLVKIQQGCGTGAVSTGFDTQCLVDYRSPIIEDSWGKKCRVIVWDRQVPTNTYIRIRVCNSSPGCETGDCDLSATGGVINNELLSYSIDGVSIKGQLQTVLSGSGESNCVRVGCIDGTTACAFETLNDVTWGSEIVVGPIGDSDLFAA
jgi:hypothetical protein